MGKTIFYTLRIKKILALLKTMANLPRTLRLSKEVDNVDPKRQR